MDKNLKIFGIIAVLIILIFISSPLASAYKPAGVETTGTMSVTVKVDEEVNWLDRIGQFFSNLAVTIQEEQYGPGDTAKGDIWGYVGAVASDEEEANDPLGPKCDQDTDVSVCVYIQHQDKSVPSAVDCTDVPMECGDLSRTSWSAEIYDEAEEGTYDVYAKYMYKYTAYDWVEKHDYGSAGTIEVTECDGTRSSCCDDNDCDSYCSGDTRYYSGDCNNIGGSCDYNTENCNNNDGYYGSKYCKGGDVWQTYRDYYCSGGSCDYSTDEKEVEDCTTGCENGECMKKPLGESLLDFLGAILRMIR